MNGHEGKYTDGAQKNMTEIKTHLGEETCFLCVCVCVYIHTCF